MTNEVLESRMVDVTIIDHTRAYVEELGCSRNSQTFSTGLFVVDPPTKNDCLRTFFGGDCLSERKRPPLFLPSLRTAELSRIAAFILHELVRAQTNKQKG